MWLPTWCTKKNCVTFWAVAGGFIIGGAFGWWSNQPRQAWIDFDRLSATYMLGSKQIEVTGHYGVERECKAGDKTGELRWTLAAIATDGQIALYGPAPALPAMTDGHHDYADVITLQEPIRPDGWQVYVTVQCSLQDFSTVISPIARLEITEPLGP